MASLHHHHIHPSSSALPLASLLFSIPLRPCLFPSSCFHSPPTCGFALHPSVLFPSLSSSSVIPRSHMVSLWICVCLVLPRVQWGSLLIWMCVLQTEREMPSVCVCVCVGFSRLCNSFICGSFREASPSWLSIFFILPLFVYPEWRPA